MTHFEIEYIFLFKFRHKLIKAQLKYKIIITVSVTRHLNWQNNKFSIKSCVCIFEIINKYILIDKNSKNLRSLIITKTRNSYSKSSNLYEVFASIYV